MAITLTEKAAVQVKEMLVENDDPNAFLRLGVDEGGCSGFSYSMGFDEKNEDDLVVQQHGVDVVIAKKYELLLKGTVVDYQEAVMGGGFTINNPNASLSCGCGASFRTATREGKPSDC